MVVRSREEVQKAIDKQADRIEERLTTIRQELTSITHPVRSYIGKHPAIAVGVVLGVGVTAGVLVASRLRSGGEQADQSDHSDPVVRQPRPTAGRTVLRMLLPILVDHGFRLLTRARKS